MHAHRVHRLGVGGRGTLLCKMIAAQSGKRESFIQQFDFSAGTISRRTERCVVNAYTGQRLTHRPRLLYSLTLGDDKKKDG